MNTLLKKLKPTDSHYIDTITELLKTTYNPLVSKYFIYQNANYPAFLQSVISTEFDSIYIAEDESTSSLIGFIQLKHRDGILFLNNIIIRQEYRGKNMGDFLLQNSVSSVVADKENLKLFALDVFEHNERAFRWYLNLGMKITSKKSWYDATPAYFNNENTRKTAEVTSQVVEDSFGFRQVLIDGKRVGTLINDKTLLLNTGVIEKDTFGQLFGLFKYSLQSIALISQEELELPLIDKSCRLEIPLAGLLTRLNLT